MSRQLKHLATQVIVITGATSQIGLATARMASKQGATLVLAASSATTLDRLASEIRQAGGVVLALPVDVAVKDQVEALGRAAVQRFGRVDTWINAGMTLGDADDIKPLQIAARLFKTHYWGAKHGASVALGLMKQDGGAIINLDSAASARHGVKGLTDALRSDIEADGVPVSVTLVHAADTTRDALHHAPRAVAEAILQAAQEPQRDVLASSAPRVAAPHVILAPRLMDRLIEMFAFRQPQKTSYS
jgi:NADP-dependent 3-hydroxy acid dehydrogenase YdfG